MMREVQERDGIAATGNGQADRPGAQRGRDRFKRGGETGWQS
jgi:hypothetical protein